MIRFFLISLFSLLYVCTISAQDLLVTINYDSLNCKIGKLRNDQYLIKFIVVNDEARSTLLKHEYMKGFIHKDSVLFYRKNVFQSMESNRLRAWYPTAEIGFSAGAAYQFDKFRIDDDLTDKSDFGARTGFCIEADLTHFVSSYVGYGLKYNFRSLLGGDLRYQYIGPIIVLRLLEREKSNHLFFSVSAGYGWMVHNNAPLDLAGGRYRILYDAHSASGDLAVGYSFRLTQNMSLRLKASCSLGYPGDVKVDKIHELPYVPDNVISLDMGHYGHNMNTFNFTVGFSFH